jgi:hypothetical protein
MYDACGLTEVQSWTGSAWLYVFFWANLITTEMIFFKKRYFHIRNVCFFIPILENTVSISKFIYCQVGHIWLTYLLPKLLIILCFLFQRTDCEPKRYFLNRFIKCQFLLHTKMHMHNHRRRWTQQKITESEFTNCFADKIQWLRNVNRNPESNQ